jgi:fatty acid desaturase
MQSAVTSRRKTIDRRVKCMFIAWVAVFFASVGLGIFGLPSLTVAGLAVLVVLFLPMACLIIYDPTLDCPHCQKRFKNDWEILESGRSGRFMICPECHIYVYTHRTLR